MVAVTLMTYDVETTHGANTGAVGVAPVKCKVLVAPTSIDAPAGACQTEAVLPAVFSRMLIDSMVAATLPVLRTNISKLAVGIKGVPALSHVTESILNCV